MAMDQLSPHRRALIVEDEIVIALDLQMPCLISVSTCPI
jgi:hypothetical protein